MLKLYINISNLVYTRDGVMPEEPAFQYIPADISPTSRPNGQCDPLEESMMLLQEGLESGSIISQFEVSLNQLIIPFENMISTILYNFQNYVLFFFYFINFLVLLLYFND